MHVHLTRLSTRASEIFGFILALGAIYIAGPSEVINEAQLRGAVILAGGIIVFLALPLANQIHNKKTPNIALWIFDGVLLVIFIFSIFTFFEIQESLWEGIFILQDRELYIGLAGALILVELTRRVFGLVMSLVCLLAFAYAAFGQNMPGFLAHAGLNLEETLLAVWFSFDGVFGFPVGVVASVVMIFIVFGALLEGTGAGAALLKLANAMTGRIRGGPAHGAIVASAIFGTISGNPVANVVGTGVFTIPLIKRQGFKPEFAGAVESAASAGGQFTPPIMGAVAFIMADLLNIPYIHVAAAAAVPALIYYFGLFSSVYSQAVRLGIGPVPETERQKMRPKDWLNSLRFILPLAVIIFVMIGGRSPAAAGFWGLITAIVVAAVLEPALLRDPRPILRSLSKGGIQSAQLIVAVGSIGILIAIINTTGVGIGFAQQLSSIAEISIGAALLVAAAGSLILGMGLPTLPAYLFIVLMIGPSITALGIDPLQTHMFVLYFGVMSNVTPPFALASFAAAPIAQANPLRTAITSSRISLAGYLIPVLFIFHPSILLVLGDFNALDFISVSIRAMIMVWLVATALTGYDQKNLGILERVARIVVACLCLSTQAEINLAAALIGLGIIFSARIRNRFAKAV